MTWPEKLLGNFRPFPPTVTLLVDRDEIVFALEAFAKYTDWDHRETDWIKSYTFKHDSGTTSREFYAGKLHIVQGDGVEVHSGTTSLSDHIVKISFSSKRKDSLPGLSFSRLEHVEVRYRMRFTKNSWVYELGSKYKASSMAAVEKIVATGEKPAEYYIELSHENWPTYYDQHSTSHVAASINLKLGDILKAVE